MRRIDFSLVVVLLVLALFGGGIYQFARTYPDANRGLLIFAKAQKDLFVDAGLIQESYQVRAPDSLTRMLRLQTVIVAAQSEPHTLYVGAGVILGERAGIVKILTARHIVAHGGQRFVVFRQGVAFKVLRVLPDRRQDLALVYVRAAPGIAYTVARIGAAGFATGQPFVVMGHPGARSWIASPGIAERHLLHTLLFCPTCDRGDSGAGAYDKSGVLRGIVVARDVIAAPNVRTGRYFKVIAFEIVRPEAIRSFLRTANV
ncbi:MAG TPA: serine protease [Candidatus Baltobacteraceae bacterium]|nr:serine protease [Candidatus Baltobacteraceae bacterium]